jgi:hypothetical protein
LYVYAARAIRIAYDRGLLADADLWRYADDEFWSRLVRSEDPDVRKAASKVRGDLRARPLGKGEEDPIVVVQGSSDGAEGGEEGEVLDVTSKVRIIDPDVVVDPVTRATKRLSELDPAYRQLLVRHVERKTGMHRVIVSYNASLPIPSH